MVFSYYKNLSAAGKRMYRASNAIDAVEAHTGTKVAHFQAFPCFGTGGPAVQLGREDL
jgi:hypothetical protein